MGEGPPRPAWRSIICNLMLALGTRGQGHCWNETGVGETGQGEGHPAGVEGKTSRGGSVCGLSFCAL